MADIALTSHSNLMNQRAQGKKLHRRTQSSSKHDFNGLMNKKAETEEFLQDMIQNQNVLNADTTQNALEADISKQVGNEIEVIVDDIEDIPNAGFIVPKANSYNPLNLISKRNLAARIGSLGNLYPVKKIHLLEQLKDNIDEFTGLGTIHEKKNSMESMDTDTMGARSPGLQSISNSQGSKNPSRTHSKHSSLDIRPGHSKTSSADFRNLNFVQPIVDLRPLSQTSKAEKENIHLSKKMSNFSNLENNETTANNAPTFGIAPAKKLTHSRSSQNAILNNYPTKTNEPGRISPKGPITPSLTLVDTISPKGSSLQGARHHTADKTVKNVKSNTLKNHTTQKDGSTKVSEIKFPVDMSSYTPTPTAGTAGVDSKISNLTESMKNLTSKTDIMENQIKSIFSVVDSFARDRNQLEEKVKAQDEKIRVLMGLASKYEEEIANLKTVQAQKSILDSGFKTNQKKARDISGPTLLTTATDVSSIESPGSDSSGFYTNKEPRETSKTLNFTLTPQGQRMFPSKNDRTFDSHNSSKRTQGKQK